MIQISVIKGPLVGDPAGLLGGRRQTFLPTSDFRCKSSIGVRLSVFPDCVTPSFIPLTLKLWDVREPRSARMRVR